MAETDMINDIFDLMKNFDGSFINPHGEVILSSKGNVYFTAINCDDRLDIACKLLEWCSRPMAKGQAYSNTQRNNDWRNSLILGLNRFLGTNFNQKDMYWIYDKLGNAVDHDLTLKFIESGYDLSLVYPKEKEQNEDYNKLP